MQFQMKERTGEVMGNKVKAKPIPWTSMRAVGEAQQCGDTMKMVEVMAGIVSRFVTLEDGSPIDADEIPAEAVGALFNFATSSEADISDFTSSQQGEDQTD